MLRDPATLFWNRSARATRLYKAGEYELACDSYELALVEMKRMTTPPANDNAATLYFNYARASQSMGRLCHASRLFGEVLGVAPKHERALEQRAECHFSLGDMSSAISDWRELTTSFGAAAEPAIRQAWARRMEEAKKLLATAAHETLGVDRYASAADVRKAYHKLSLQFHPDKHASSSEDVRERARHRFARIQAAYESLSARRSPAGGHAPRSQGSSRTRTWYGHTGGGDDDDDDEYDEPFGADNGAPPGYDPFARRGWEF